MPRKAQSKSDSSDAPETRLSMAAENYLLSIYRLDEQGERVTLTHLSEHLKTLPEGEGMGTSLPSVGGMIRRMVREGYVESTANKGVILTDHGRKFAEVIVRRHRLAERMVVDLLGLELQYAHIEAHRLEHAISPLLEQKIVSKLGNPTTCPFGHPIPGSDSQIDERSVTLDTLSPGQRLIIEMIPEDDQPLLEYLVDNKIVPGQPVQVKDAALARGVFTLDCDGKEVVFSYDVASKIRVCPDVDE